MGQSFTSLFFFLSVSYGQKTYFSGEKSISPCPGLCAGSLPLKGSIKLSTVGSWDFFCKRESLAEVELAYSHLGFHLCQTVLRKRFGILSFKTELPIETQRLALCGFLIVYVYSWLIFFLCVSPKQVFICCVYKRTLSAENLRFCSI